MREDWIEIELRKLFETVTGNTPSKKDPLNYGSDMPLIKPPELENKPISNAKDYLSETGASKARILPEGSVLVTCIGNLGRAGIAKYPVAFNQQINAIKPLKGIDSKFTFYQCQNPFFRRDLERLSSATTVPIVNKGKFNSIRVKLAPLPEQRAIVAKIEQLFSELDNGIVNLQAAKDKLEIYRQAVLKKAFEGELTNTAMAKVEFKELMDDKPQNGLYKPKSEYGSGTKIIRIDGFYDGVILENYGYQRVKISDEEIKKYSIEEGNILVNRVNSMSHLGKCGLVKKVDEPTVFESNIMKVQFDESKSDPNYLRYYLSSLMGIKELTKNAKQAVNQASINQKDVSNSIIAYCTKPEQAKVIQEIESRLSVCDNVLSNIEEGLEKAKALRQSILKKAFEGKLLNEAELEACKKEPDWEPAEKLLERIKTTP